MSKNFITLKYMQTALESSKSTILRHLKPKRTEYIEKGLIVQSKGNKRTLYKIELLEILKENFKQSPTSKNLSIDKEFKKDSEKEYSCDSHETVVTQSWDGHDTVVTQSKNDKNFKILSLEKDIKYLNDKLKEKQKIEKDLELLNLKLENKDKKFEELLDRMNKKDQRHDTIVMTMSKQLESLNEKFLLLEDKTNKDSEGFFRTYSPSINQAFIFIILVIVYIKILYI